MTQPSAPRSARAVRPARRSPPRAQVGEPLGDDAFARALTGMPLHELVPVAQRWQQHQVLTARAGGHVPSHRTAWTPGDLTPVTPAPVDTTSSVRRLLDRLEALAHHPGWASDPNDPAWGTVLHAVLLGASPMLPLLAAWHLEHAPMAALLIDRGGLRRLAKPYTASETDAKTLDLERWTEGPGGLTLAVMRRMTSPGSPLVAPLVAHALAQRLEPALLQRALAAGLSPNASTGTGVTLTMGLTMEPWPAFDGEAAFHAWAGTTVPYARRLDERLAALQRAGADLDARDALGDTALHHAVRLDDRPMIRHLIARGANGTLGNGAGITPQEGLDEQVRGTRAHLARAQASQAGGFPLAMGSNALRLVDLLIEQLKQQEGTQAVLRTALVAGEQAQLMRAADLSRPRSSTRPGTPADAVEPSVLPQNGTVPPGVRRRL